MKKNEAIDADYKSKEDSAAPQPIANGESISENSANAADSDISQYVVDAQPGVTLRKLREAYGYSVHDVASGLHLSSYYIKNIEEGLYHKLPSNVFARGYLRSYAALFGLDPKIVIDLFVKHIADESAGSILSDSPAQPIEAAAIEVTKKTPVSSYMLIAAIILVTMFLVSYYIAGLQQSVTPVTDAKRASNTQQLGNNDTQLPFKPADSSTNLEETGRPEVFVDQDVNTETNLDGATGMPIFDTLNTEQQPITGLQESVSSATVGIKSRLAFQFTGDCWLEVTYLDDNGALNYIFSGYKYAGESLALDVKLPVNVIIGNADVARLWVSDTPYDFSNDISQSTRVARFRIERP